MADDLEERLISHAKAFEGLMSLIPAKHYYGEDTSDQWQRKKQTKEQKKAAKKAKLNPDSHKSAKDVMDENERKRKREMELDGEDISDLDASGKEQPKEGLKAAGKKTKKQKLNDGSTAEGAQPGQEQDQLQPQDEEARRKAKAEKRKEKEQRKKEKLARRQEKAETRKARKLEVVGQSVPNESVEVEASTNMTVGGGDAAADDAGDVTVTNEMDRVDVSGLVEDSKRESQSSRTPSPAPHSPLSETSALPSASSTSSIVPPTTAHDLEKPIKAHKLPKIDQEVLKARLQARIEALRAARKADGIDGKPARSRQELIEARRRKEEQRKLHKKELRKQAKEDEQRAAAEAELARLRGSGSPLTPDIFSPRSPDENFAFGRVAFDDGQQADSRLSTLLDARKRKGPQDPRTALEAAQKKHARINGFDAAKKADIEEKDLWLNARKRAHGERVRDDTSLLKKTLKRKEKMKQKSEKEWNERIEGVKKGQEMRQKKREDNLRKRKEEKGNKGIKGGSKKPAKKAKGRPGFEGSFRSKAK